MNNKVAKIFMHEMSGLQFKCYVCGLLKNLICSYGAPIYHYFEVSLAQWLSVTFGGAQPP